jgi:hypothetical protein
VDYRIGELVVAGQRERYVAWRPAGDPIEDGMVLRVETTTMYMQLRGRIPIPTPHSIPPANGNVN